mmetsp:Transcript_132265/g.334140  ORF Transcript_132265/g.334140 Transcript_132265/m.334140 type:complete len:632 (+) Transcript_132265:3-1898(+)
MNRDLIVDPVSDSEVPAAQPTDFPVAAAVKGVHVAAAGRMLSKEVIAARHAAPGAHVASRKRVLGDPRTLYGRGGGIFGLAKLADALMEAWMANPALNANRNVARWNELQQRHGFKFLVTQIMGYLTGGPQRYTGRPMEEAHKHLAITLEEWDTFMSDARRVFRDFKLDARMQRELTAILSTYQSSCVLRHGEVAPPNLGSHPSSNAGTTLYHRLGGVYPIAQFVDRLVDLVVVGNRVHIELSPIYARSGNRHPPGLKYMLTELVCNGTGGPEVVTSKGFDEAKLGVQLEEWPMFLELASEAAAVWPIQHLRNAVVVALGALKAEICIGIAEDDPSPVARARRQIQEAGFGHYLASAALERCSGEASRALELLARGWTPVDDDAMSSGSLSSFPGFDPSGPRCPFARPGAALPLGHPPIGHVAPRDLPLEAVPQNVAAADERLGKAVRALADQGMAPSQIASLLDMDEASMRATLDKVPAEQVRMLGNSLQAELDGLLEEDPELCCPVSLLLCVEPVIASDGFIYEKASLLELIRNGMASPMTRETLKSEYIYARQCKSNAIQFRTTRSAELLRFAEAAADDQMQMALEALGRASEYIEVLTTGHVPGLAKQAAQLWHRLGQPEPLALRGL